MQKARNVYFSQKEERTCKRKLHDEVTLLYKRFTRITIGKCQERFPTQKAVGSYKR